MNNDLKHLLELQDIDLNIIKLEKSKEEFPVQVEEFQKAISEARDALEDTKARREEVSKEKKAVEEQITNAKLSLEKSQERLNSIKTNKEYDAVHSEIETHKHIVATADKRLQKFTSEIEALESTSNEEQDAYDAMVAENQPQIDDLNAKIATIDSSIADVVSERDNLVPKINKLYVRAYDHIRSSRKKGMVISIVNSTDRNCSVCYQLVPPQLLNQTRKADNIVYCQSCGSILIWGENGDGHESTGDSADNVNSENSENG